MKKHCARLVAGLLLLGAIGIGNAATDFHGVINPNNVPTAIDSVYLIVTPDSLSYATPGWGGTGTTYDTFDFTPPDLNAWPQRVWVIGTVQGLARRVAIENPPGEKWYGLGMGIVTSFVMFYGAGMPGVEQPGLAVEPLQRLVVSPSVVTEQMTVRLQPAGIGSSVVQIHDAVGNVIRSLDCTTGADGFATATWNREDDRGRLAAEGIYFCRYAAAGVVAVRKVLVAH